MSFTILYYHFINTPGANTRIKGLYTTPKHFEWQIKTLIKNKFTFITFEDIVKNQYHVNKKNLILTFDDGCESLYMNAFPIMRKYGITGVIYLVTNAIGDRNIIWKDNENKDPLNILTKNQILEMRDYGFEFGSHLCNHVHLPELNEDEIRDELLRSKKMLETELGVTIYSVAYPFGSYDGRALEIAKESGYLFGVTTKNGDNSLTSNLELFRFAVKGYALRHYWYFIKLIKLKILRHTK
jgi:peptidoglycan/xylan/chitin deacetylase (PgdA/CDA1 family)